MKRRKNLLKKIVFGLLEVKWLIRNKQIEVGNQRTSKFNLNFIFILLLILFIITFSEHLFKVVMTGDTGVGKSCTLLRFCVSNINVIIIRVIFI